MGVDLMMEPYATMCQDERPESRIFDELCFPDIDKLFARLGLNWDDFFATADIDGRLPHDAALIIVEAHAIALRIRHTGPDQPFHACDGPVRLERHRRDGVRQRRFAQNGRIAVGTAGKKE